MGRERASLRENSYARTLTRVPVRIIGNLISKFFWKNVYILMNYS